jgi:hypothetical protein
MSENQSPEKTEVSEQCLLEVHKECGEQMRFYADARFRIMILVLTLTSVLISAQRLLVEIVFVFDLIGLVSTIALYSLEYRYRQAWDSFLRAQRDIQDELFGPGGGPFHLFRGIMDKPWYVVRSRHATNILYGILFLIWVGGTIFHGYQLIAKFIVLLPFASSVISFVFAFLG